MEEKVVFYFSLVVGLVLFASIAGWIGGVEEAALEGEVRVLMKNLGEARDQVASAPLEDEVEASFDLPRDMGGDAYTLSLASGRLTVRVGGRSYSGSLDALGGFTASGGDVLVFSKPAGGKEVRVRRL